jgi:TetR/AcrR family transcriptional repressor of bet genes
MEQAAAGVKPGETIMVRAKSDKQRRALIDAAIRVVARAGHPGATVGALAKEAGLAAGIVSFYFGGKDKLLTASLDDLIRDYDSVLHKHLKAAGSKPQARLAAMIDAAFDPEALDPTRVAAWFAFWADEMSRAPRRDSATRKERKYTRMAIVECRRLAQKGRRIAVNPAVAGTGLSSLLDGFWWGLMIDPKNFDREQARAACHAYLAAIYPGYRRGS